MTVDFTVQVVSEEFKGKVGLRMLPLTFNCKSVNDIDNNATASHDILRSLRRNVSWFTCTIIENKDVRGIAKGRGRQDSVMTTTR